MSTPIYNPHHWNGIAKDIRDTRSLRKTKVRWEVLDSLALNIALRFKLDDPNFDSDRFFANTYPKGTK